VTQEKYPLLYEKLPRRSDKKNEKTPDLVAVG